MPGWPGWQPAGAAHFRLAPSRAAYLRYVRSVLPVAGIFIVLAVVRMATGWDDPVNRWGAVALLVVAVGAALTVIDYLRHSGVELTPTDLVMVGIWRRRRTIPRSDLGRCVMVQGLATASFAGPAANLFVLRRDGSKAIRLSQGFYAEPDLIALSRALGVPVDGIGGVISARDLRARYPGTASWVESHMVAFTVLVVVAIIVVVVVAVVLLDG